MPDADLSDAEYSQLLGFRTSLREFLHWSEAQAREAGLSPAVQLIDRAEQRDLVRRHADTRDGRVVRLRLTPVGRRRLRRLSALHLEEIARLAPALRFL